MFIPHKTVTIITKISNHLHINNASHFCHSRFLVDMAAMCSPLSLRTPKLRNRDGSQKTLVDILVMLTNRLEIFDSHTQTTRSHQRRNIQLEW